jgi:prepilin-type N-terminal cleavage/methylation domain-containing protein
MRRFVKQVSSGQSGFSMLELLIVVAILGILAAVIAVNLISFITVGKLGAANTEVSNTKIAASGYMADNNHVWPSDSTVLDNYLDTLPDTTYTFNVSNGLITTATGGWADDGLIFDIASQMWLKAP